MSKKQNKLEILLAWLEDNVEMGTDILFTDGVDSAAMIPAVQAAVNLLNMPKATSCPAPWKEYFMCEAIPSWELNRTEAAATGDDELAMAEAVKTYRAEKGVAESAITEYYDHIKRLTANKVALASFQCPACEHDLLTQATDPGEQWDTFSTCPYCGSVFLKITRGDKVEVRRP